MILMTFNNKVQLFDIPCHNFQQILSIFSNLICIFSVIAVVLLCLVYNNYLSYFKPVCVCVDESFFFLTCSVLISFAFYQMRFLLLFSRQGKLRLQKWFTPMSDREKKKIIREMTSMVLSRQPRSCNFLHWKDLKIIYKRWALPAHVVSLDFVFVCTKTRAMAETAFYATCCSPLVCSPFLSPFLQVCQPVFLPGRREPGE